MQVLIILHDPHSQYSLVSHHISRSFFMDLYKQRSTSGCSSKHERMKRHKKYLILDDYAGNAKLGSAQLAGSITKHTSFFSKSASFSLQ